VVQIGQKRIYLGSTKNFERKRPPERPEAMLHACTPRPRKDILGHPYFAWLIVIFNFRIRPLLILYHTPHCEHRPMSHASLALASALNAPNRVQTRMTFVLEACD